MTSIHPSFTSLFPAIRELHIVEGYDLPVIPSVISPSLRRLVVNSEIVYPDLTLPTEAATPADETHLHIATCRAPLLESFRLSGTFATAMAIRSLIPVKDLRHLRILDIGGVEVAKSPALDKMYCELISGLSILDKLTELHLPSRITLDHISERLGFQSLEVLYTSCDIPAVTRFVNAISSSNLRTMILEHFYRDITRPSLQALIDALCHHYQLSLRTLHFISNYSTHLSPTFASELRHLEDVKLLLHAEMSVEDAHMMASAWPNLRSLKLATPTFTFMTCKFDCLVPFARLCPKLDFLQVDIYGCEHLDVLSLPQLQHGLQSLLLGRCWGAIDVAHLAALVDRLFPQLETVSAPRELLADAFFTKPPGMPVCQGRMFTSRIRLQLLVKISSEYCLNIGVICTSYPAVCCIFSAFPDST